MAAWDRDRRAQPDPGDDAADPDDAARLANRLNAVARLTVDAAALHRLQTALVPARTGERAAERLAAIAREVLARYPDGRDLHELCRAACPRIAARDVRAFGDVTSRHGRALLEAISERAARAFADEVATLRLVDGHALVEDAREQPLAELRRRRAVVKAQTATLEAGRMSAQMVDLEAELEPSRQLWGGILIPALGDTLGSRLYAELRAVGELNRQVVHDVVRAVVQEVERACERAGEG